MNSIYYIYAQPIPGAVYCRLSSSSRLIIRQNKHPCILPCSSCHAKMLRLGALCPSLCRNGSTEMSPPPDQAAHRTGRPDEHGGGGVLSAIDYRLSRLEMAFNLDISQDYPTSQLPRAVDVTSQRLLRLEKAAIERFQEHFEELWHEHQEANSASFTPSAHVAADAKHTLEAQAKQQVRQRLRYQPPVGIGAHTRALSTPTVINDAGEQGDASTASANAARVIGALHPCMHPSALPSRSNWRQVKRRL